MDLCARGYLVAAVSAEIVDEATRNTTRKLGELGLHRLRRHLAAVGPVEAGRRPAWRISVNAKDTHVVEAALGAGASFLLTMDRNLMAELAGQRLPFQCLTPATSSARS